MGFSILQLNAWLLPFPFSAANEKRIRGLIELIKTMDPDIVTLQEVWLNRYVEILKKMHGYYLYTAGQGIFNRSGLVVMLKIKPDLVEFIGFDNEGSNIVEKIAKKGCLIVKIKHKQTQISIVNTHLYYSQSRRKKKIKMKEFEKLKEIEKNQIQKNVKCIISGDLNMKPDEFLELNKGYFKFTDYFFDVEPKDKYEYYRFNRFTTSNKGIIYLLTNTNQNVTIKSQKIIEPILSDHLAIFSVVNTH